MVDRRIRSAAEDGWSASWIWCEGEARPRNFYLYARKTFALRARPSRAELRITADSRYKLFVNGNFVGRGPVPSHPSRLSYDTYDITGLLGRGQNAIAVLVHHVGQGTYSYIPGRAALICQAEVESEGETQKIVTDETWRVMPAAAWTQAGERMSRRLGYQEVYDARLAADGWIEPKFNDARWPQAKVLGRPPMQPFDRLVLRQIPRLTEQVVRPAGVVGVYECPPMPPEMPPADVPHFVAAEELIPAEKGRVTRPERLLNERNDAAIVSVPQSGGVAIVLDFGREVSGCVEIEVEKASGGILDIGYSELLEDGRVKPDRGEVRYSDRLILKSGRQVWCSFGPRAFRYVQIDLRGCPRPVCISHVLVRETTYPVELRGNFESSDSALNEIWMTGARTARLCMDDTFIDSPWRERAQWWDNAAIAARTAHYAFGDSTLLAQGLRHIAASQRGDGAVSALYPSATKELFPDLGAIWVMSVWDCYAQTEDRGLLADLYPAVVRWLGWIGRFIDRDGLLSRVEGDVFIDWAEIDRRGEITALNCLYLGALAAARRMADALRRESDAQDWATRASAVRVAIAKHLWSPRHGLYADCRVEGKLQDHYSRQTNVLAALFDVADHYQKASIFRLLLDERGLPPITTPYFTTFLVEALSRSGYDHQALDLIRRKWGGMLSSGATTFWEYFSPTGSLCQGSAMGATYLLQAHFLGVRPTGDPGRVRIEPHPADLQWARGVVPTHAGPVAVEWKNGRRGFSMTIELPGGVSAEVCPPKENGFSRVLVDGRDVFEPDILLGPGVHRVAVMRPARSARVHPVRHPEAEEEKQSPLPVPPGRADIETVEQMIRILTELGGPPAEEEEQPAEAPKARRRSRRRPRRARVAQGVDETAAPAVEEQPQSPEEEPVDAQPAREQPRRGRRRRRPPAQAVGAPPSSDVRPPPAEADQTAIEPPDEAEKPAEGNGRKPHRRPRRRRRPAARQAAEAVASEDQSSGALHEGTGDGG